MGNLLRKKKNLIIAIAICSVLLLTAVCGVLVSSTSKGSDKMVNGAVPSADRSPVNIVWGDIVGKKPEGEPLEGRAISTQNELDIFIAENASPDRTNKCYLTQDITYNVVGASSGNTGSTSKFYGTLDGNGHKIIMNSNRDDWSEPNMQSVDGVESMGLFMGINYATIKNVTFVYNGTMKIGYNSQRWAAGIVCGTNKGTIKNVRLDINGSFACHFNGGLGDHFDRISLGGICGVNWNTIKDVHVQMGANSRLEGNAKSKRSPTALSKSYKVMCAVGGVIGSTVSGHTTQNLSIIAPDTATIKSNCEEVSSLNSGPRDHARFMGSVIGFSGRNVQGVYSDFKGAFEANNGPHFFPNHTERQLIGAMAYCDVPTNYYCVQKYAVINGLASQGDFISMDNWDPFTSEKAAEITNNNAISTDGYIGDMTMTFDQTKVGIARLENHLTRQDDKNLIFWDVQGKGQWDGEYHATYEKICGYDYLEGVNNRKNFNIVLSLTQPFDIQFTMGHSYKPFTDIDFRNNWNGLYSAEGEVFKMAYTGEDLRTKFANQALKAIGRNDIAYKDGAMKFIPQGGGTINSLVTPNQYQGVQVQSTINPKFAYFNAEEKVCVDLTTINLQVTKTVINDLGNLSNWQTSQTINVAVPNQVVPVDKIEYKISGTEDGYKTATGASFVYDTNTSIDGVTLDLVGFKNGEAVTEVKTTGIVKVDKDKPYSDFDPATLTPEVWRNKDIDYAFNAKDDISGIKSVTILNNGQTTSVFSSIQEGSVEQLIDYIYTNHNAYTITITDMAGNSTSLVVEPHIDKEEPKITSYFFYTLGTNDEEVEYTGLDSVQKTIYARVNYTVGPSGGYLKFMVGTPDEGLDNGMINPEYLAPNTTQFTLAWNEDTSDVKDGILLNIFVSSAALDENGENAKYHFVEPNIPIKLGQNYVYVTKDNIKLEQITKVYDGNILGKAEWVTILREQEEHTENPNIEKIVEFSQSNAGEGLSITVTLKNKQGFNNAFAYEDEENNRIVYENNTPVFVFSAEEVDGGISITKKAVIVKINSATKVYGEPNPIFTANVEGLVGDDTINYELYTDVDEKAIPNAEGYAIKANEEVVFDNYTASYVEEKLYVQKRAITELSVTPFDPNDAESEGKDPYQTNFSNTFTFCYVARFLDPFGEYQYFTVAYFKNGAPFVYGQDAVAWGKYTYACSMPQEFADRYVDNVSDGIKNGFFTIVSDMAYAGIDFEIEGDADNDGKIVLEFANKTIDFASLIKYNNDIVKEFMSVKYGASEENTAEEAFGEDGIKNIGTYTIVLILAKNDRYEAKAFTYTLEITKANVNFEMTDVNVVYDGVAHPVVIPEQAKEQLVALGVSEDQIKLVEIDQKGNVLGNYSDKIDAGEYQFKLTIENENIVTINKTAKILIEKATIAIEIADITKDYDGKAVEFGLSSEDKQKLADLKVDLQSEVVFDKENLIDAGAYKVKLTITNKNINSVVVNFNVVINATKIADEFAFEVKTDVIYDGNPKTLRLLDEHTDMAYDIKYIDPVECVNAGIYKFKAIVSKHNYETVTVEGELVIGKADLSDIVDELGVWLDSITKEYDGTPAILDFDEETKALLVENGINYTITGNRQVKAGYYSVEAKLTKPNYENLPVSGYIEIEPKVVDIQYIFNEQDYVDTVLLKAGDDISVSAYYINIKGEQVPVSLTLQQFIKGKKGEEDTYEDFDFEDDMIPDGKYAFVAEISDENYIASEETEMALFEIKSPVPVVPIAVGAGVGGTAVVGGGVALAVVLILKKKKMGL